MIRFKSQGSDPNLQRILIIALDYKKKSVNKPLKTALQKHDED